MPSLSKRLTLNQKSEDVNFWKYQRAYEKELKKKSESCLGSLYAS